MEHDGGRDAERERHHPALDGESDRAALHLVRVDLEPGEEDEEHETHLRERIDHLVEVRPAQHVRSDHHAEPDLDHDAGDACPPLGEVGDERTEGRDRDDQDEGAECF